MSRNGNLQLAKNAKNDEFYTRLEDIEAELCHEDYAAHFRGKVVYCNCDDPARSEFWKFFVRVFDDWGLKRLVATHYVPGGLSFCHVLENSGAGVRVMPLSCDGDFRSDVCIEILKASDIVVTNPPFSLFREHVGQIIKYKKSFLIIGNMNAITYKEFFPFLMCNQVWLGYEHPKKFVQLDGSLKSFGNILWYTNLDIQKRHVPLDLRGNVYYGNEAKYPVYDNYDAIECSRVVDIPGDYFGRIGVPITFLDKYCPGQFEIVGVTLGNTVDYEMTKIYRNAVQHNKDGSVQGGGKVNTRASILVDTKPLDTLYYTADGVAGYLLCIYPRILIRRV